MSQATAAGHGNSLAELFKVVQVFHFTQTLSNLFNTLLKKDIAHPARGAVSAALFHKKIQKAVDYLQDIASYGEDHNRASGWQILQAKPTLKLALIDHLPAGTAHLYRSCFRRINPCQQFSHSGAVRQFIHPRTGTVPTDAKQFGTRALDGAEAAKPDTAPVNNAGSAAEGLNVVDHGGKSEIPGLHRKWRAILGFATQPFAGTNQCALFATNISASPHLDANIKTESLLATYVIAQQRLFPPRLEHRFQIGKQISILGTQVDDA